MKKKLRIFLPGVIQKKILSLINIVKLHNFTGFDLTRYRKFSSTQSSTLSQGTLSAQIIFYTHQIEKGLSRTQFSKKRGIGALTSLADYLKRYDNHNDITYIAALSAIKSYTV